MLRGLCLLILLLALLPAYAQPAADYPTLDALAESVIPPFDPVDAARRLRGLGDIPATPAAAAPRQTGERQLFWVLNAAGEAQFQASAALRVVGQHLYLWVQDTDRAGNPIRPMADAELEALAEAFDRRVYPQVRALWGEEASPGVDGDPRLYALFVQGLGGGTAAYFASRHTYPAAVYPTSNQHEMFLVNLDLVAGRPLWLIESTLAHEFQHMIRANRQPNQALWLNEGFSTFTQLLLYQDAGSALAFLQQPGVQLNTWPETAASAPHYGAALLFVTYFYERFGADALRRLSDDPGIGLDAFEAALTALGEPGVADFFADWVLANILFDPALADGRYGYRLLPSNLPGAQARAAVAAYPYLTTAEAVPYSADYYILSGLGGLSALEIGLEAAADTRLLPTDAAEGAWLWASGRGDFSNPRLTRAFDLTQTAAATLIYRAWYHLEDRWDYAYLTVSRDGGVTWDILPAPHTTADNPHGNAYGPGYTGSSGGWIEERVSLDAYAGQEILVRFEVFTDDAINQPGFALDEVRLPEIGYASGFETDGGGWQAEGWLRTDNRLPLKVWVQAVQRVGDAVIIERWQTPAQTRRVLPLAEGVSQVILAVSPVAPVTTVPVAYTLWTAGR